MRHGTHFADAAAVELESALVSGPFHTALRAAITARRLSLQRVQHHLARRGINVGVTSLSYWQQGARRPQREESLGAVRALEEILQLPPEALLRLLSDPAGEPSGPRIAVRSPRSRAAASGALEQLLADLDLSPDGGLHTLGRQDRARIGARRELLGHDSQHVVRAHRPGADRYAAVHYGDPGCDPARVRASALENCRVGRVLRHAEAGVVVAELLFDTRLRTGDTHLFRYAFEDGTAGPATEYTRAFPAGGGQYVLQVRFDTAALPVRCHRFSRLAPTAPRAGRQDLPLNRHHRSVHFVEPQVRAGMLGIGWDWS